MAIQLDNIPFEWENVSISIAGLAYTLDGITDISGIGMSRDPAELRGRGNKPLEYTKGQVTFNDVSMTLNLSTWETITNLLGFEDIVNGTHERFDIQINITNPDFPDQSVRRTLVRCLIFNFDQGLSQGPDPLQVTVQMKVLDITK